MYITPVANFKRYEDFVVNECVFVLFLLQAMNPQPLNGAMPAGVASPPHQPPPISESGEGGGRGGSEVWRGEKGDGEGGGRE